MHTKKHVLLKECTFSIAMLKCSQSSHLLPILTYPWNITIAIFKGSLMLKMLTFPILSSSHDIEKKLLGHIFSKDKAMQICNSPFMLVHVMSKSLFSIVIFNISIQHWKHLIKWPAVFSLSRDFPASGHLVAFQDLISSSDCQTLRPWPGASVSLSLSGNFTWLWKATVFFLCFMC